MIHPMDFTPKWVRKKKSINKISGRQQTVNLPLKKHPLWLIDSPRFLLLLLCGVIVDKIKKRNFSFSLSFFFIPYISFLFPPFLFLLSSSSSSPSLSWEKYCRGREEKETREGAASLLSSHEEHHQMLHILHSSMRSARRDSNSSH